MKRPPTYPDPLDAYEKGREADRIREDKLAAALRERIKELERAAAELALTVSADPTRRNHIPPAILAKINALTAILKGAKP